TDTTQTATSAPTDTTPSTTDTSSTSPGTTPTTPQTWTPTITSDQADYAPGATVTLTGAGWAPFDSVHIFVNDDIRQTWSYNTDVTSDANGAFTTQFSLPSSFVAAYSVVATGLISGTARTSFTDANLRINGKDNQQHDTLAKEEDLLSITQGTPLTLTCPPATAPPPSPSATAPGTPLT